MSESDWSAKVAWMRKVQARTATFHPTGELASVHLDPEQRTPETQHATPEESIAALKKREDEALAERRRRSLAATPGLRATHRD